MCGYTFSVAFVAVHHFIRKLEHTRDAFSFICADLQDFCLIYYLLLYYPVPYPVFYFVRHRKLLAKHGQRMIVQTVRQYHRGRHMFFVAQDDMRSGACEPRDNGNCKKRSRIVYHERIHVFYRDELIPVFARYDLRF